jgi:uncharacterized protein YycO
MFKLMILLSSLSLAKTNLEPGDIIMQSEGVFIETASRVATGSKWTHVGIVINHKGRNCVLEAIKTITCTSINSYLKRGKDHLFLRPRKKLSNKAKRKISHAGSRMIGKKYDYKLSWGDDKLYCSELVYKVYLKSLGIKIGRPKKVKYHLLGLTLPIVKFSSNKLPHQFKSLSRININDQAITPGSISRSLKLRRILIR